jgi:hypothetical protein
MMLLANALKMRMRTQTLLMHISNMTSPATASSVDYARHHTSDTSRPEDQRKQFGGRLVRSKSFTTAEEEKRHHLLWSLMQQYLGNDKKSLQINIVQHIEYTLCRTRLDFTKFHGFQGTAHCIRDRLIERFNDTSQHFAQQGARRM